MNNLIVNIQKKTSEKNIIMASLFALIFTALSCITYFMGYIGDYNNGEWVYEFGFRFPSFFGLIFFLLTIVPPVLLVVYLTKFHKNLKATSIVPVIFGLIALYNLFTILERLLYGFYFSGIFDLLYFIFEIALMVSFIVVLLDALKGMTNKKLITIVMLIGIVSEIPHILMFFSNLVRYISNQRYLYLFTVPMSILGYIGFYISLLLFGVKNKIPALVISSSVKKADSKISPEQSLKLLKDKLELGMITEEEYQTQRAEIISKL